VRRVPGQVHRPEIYTTMKWEVMANTSTNGSATVDDTIEAERRLVSYFNFSVCRCSILVSRAVVFLIN
jgi:hypothetical protein